jgi:hypothetical protein
MMRAEEWDWPPTRRRKYYRSPKFYRTIDIYPPSGWNSPITKKIVSAYCHVMITAIKMLLAIPLTIMLIGSIWLLWILALIVIDMF